MRPADSSERVLTPEAPALGPSRRLALCLRSRPGRAGRWGGGRRVGEGPLHPRGRDPCGLLGNRSAVAWDPAHTPRHHLAVHSRRKRAGPRDTHTGAGQGRARGRSGARTGAEPRPGGGCQRSQRPPGAHGLAAARQAVPCLGHPVFFTNLPGSEGLGSGAGGTGGLGSRVGTPGIWAPGWTLWGAPNTPTHWSRGLPT